MRTSLIMIFLLYSARLFAQTEEEITNVKVPVSPSAVIIGSQPATIAKPKSWQSLEASLFSNYFNSEGAFTLPNDYSLEFTPYWSMKSSKISIEDFLTPDLLTSVKQNFSLSVSSTKNYIISDTAKTDAMGFGMRTMLFQGTKTDREAINYTYRNLQGYLSISNRVFRLVESETCSSPCDKNAIIKLILDKIAANPDILKPVVINNLRAKWMANLKTFLEANLAEKDYSSETSRDAVSNTMDNFLKIDSTLINIEKLRSDRTGFKLELAGALALNFPTNKIDFSYASRYGIWITPSFQPSGKDLQWIEFLGVFRYFKYNDNFYAHYLPGMQYYDNNIDYGVKAALKWKKFNIDLEGALRASKVIISKVTDASGNTVLTTRNIKDSQFLLTLNYQVNEHILLSYNFGKQFTQSLYYEGNLVSLISLNFGLGAPKVKDL